MDRTLTTKTQCTDCEDEVHDFASEEHYITEYQLERVPQRADNDWSSADVRVQVRGNSHSRSYGTNRKPEANTRESLVAVVDEHVFHFRRQPLVFSLHTEAAVFLVKRNRVPVVPLA